MALFLNGIVVFLILAIGFGAVLLAVVRSAAGKEFRISRRAFAYGLAIPLAVGLVFLGVGAFLEWHEEPEFCGKLCHSMEPLYEAYENPANNSMMSSHLDEGVGCTGCHVGPGWWGQVEAYWAVPHELWSNTFNTYDPDDLGGGLKEESCLKCHDGDVANAPGDIIAFGEIPVPVPEHEKEEPCGACHQAHAGGRGLNATNTCKLCHGLDMEDFEASIELHANRTSYDCMECHDRHHPDDARVPWKVVGEDLDMEFCQDCHAAEYDAYVGSSTEASLELYGECLDCHTEHVSSEAFHSHEEPYDQCSDCHPNYEGNATVHDRTGVTYLGVSDVGNDLCDKCHVNESEGLDLNKQHRGLDCVYCHGDHLVIATDFAECTVCHPENIPSWHDETSDRCTRSSCHGEGWYH